MPISSLTLLIRSNLPITVDENILSLEKKICWAKVTRFPSVPSLFFAWWHCEIVEKAFSHLKISFCFSQKTRSSGLRLIRWVFILFLFFYSSNWVRSRRNLLRRFFFFLLRWFVLYRWRRFFKFFSQNREHSDVTLKVQIFTGTYLREDFFSRMGRILVFSLYFRALFDAFWNIFCKALGVWPKISRNRENFYPRKFVPLE